MAKIKSDIKDILDLDNIKEHNWALNVLGAYVQDPSPAVVGLDEFTLVTSSDAAALYPTGIIYGNIGFDTIRDRIYDPFIVRKIIELIDSVFQNKKTNPELVEQAVDGFSNALHTVLLAYFAKKKSDKKTVAKKKDATEFTMEYYPKLLKRILSYDGDLKDIYKPIDDRTYYLLKSCLFPILETITWLNPQNLGYNQTAVECVFFNDNFIKKRKDVFIMKDINSTKTTFEIMPFDLAEIHFGNRIINSYGVLFDKHDDNLAFDVELLIEALDMRNIIKGRMLVLEAIHEQLVNIPESVLEYFSKASINNGYLSEDQANQILNCIGDPEDIREKRIKSLCEVSIPIFKYLEAFLLLRISQLNIVQLGIKVAANSAYGIYGLVTWPFASPLIGNAITNIGKVYGIKLFQAVSVDILEKLKEGGYSEFNV